MAAVSVKNRPIVKFKNIRVTKDGYQVVVVREKKAHNQFFAGLTKQSLKKAEEYRDKLLKKIPSKRISAIPRRVLNALELTAPVVGVFKHRNRPHYGVAYTDETGRRCSRAFPYRDRNSEVTAYSDAIKFRKKMVRESLQRLKKAFA